MRTGRLVLTKRSLLLRLACTTIVTGLAMAQPSRAGFVVTTFSGLAYNSNVTAMDATLGITGYTIDGFENTVLIPGLSVTFSFTGIPGNIAPVTLTTLPNLFDPTHFPPVDGDSGFSNNTWDGTYALTNGGNGNNTFSYNFASLTTFSFAPGTSSMGIGLANFQSAASSSTNPFPITDHELFVNGVPLGTIESLAGANWTAGENVRNAYVRIDATGSDTITSIAFQNLTGRQDGLVFDHLAINEGLAAAPEPSSLTLAGIGLAGLLGYAWRRRKNQRFRLPNTRGFVTSFCGLVKDQGEKNMRRTKLNLCRMWLVFVLALFGSGRADAGMIIASHQGANDPLAEGFSLWPYNDGISAGPLVDSGHSGWDIVSTSMTSPASQAVYTSGPLTGSQLTALNTQGWVMSLAGRVISGPTFDNSTTALDSAVATFGEGSIRYDIEVGLNNNGDTVVTLANNVTVNSNYSVSTPGLSYTLTGSGSSYHEYDLVYDAVTQTASLYVDGIQRITGYTGISGNPNNHNYGLLFGSINEANTNFTLAQVETGGLLAVPEPASFSLLAIGGLGLLGLSRRSRRRASR